MILSITVTQSVSYTSGAGHTGGYCPVVQIKQAQRGRGADVLAASEEIGMYGRLSQSIRALIAGAEPLMKPLTAQHRLLEGVTSLSGHKKDLEESVASTR